MDWTIVKQQMERIETGDYVTIRDLSLLTGFSEVSIRTHISRPEFEKYRIIGSSRPLKYKNSKELIAGLAKYIKQRKNMRAWSYV